MSSKDLPARRLRDRVSAPAQASSAFLTSQGRCEACPSVPPNRYHSQNRLKCPRRARGGHRERAAQDRLEPSLCAKVEGSRILPSAFGHGYAAVLAATPERRKASRSAFIVSAFVAGMPCGKPL